MLDFDKFSIRVAPRWPVDGTLFAFVGHERLGEANPVDRFGRHDRITVRMRDEVFASVVHQETDQVGTHVVTALEAFVLAELSSGP